MGGLTPKIAANASSRSATAASTPARVSLSSTPAKEFSGIVRRRACEMMVATSRSASACVGPARVCEEGSREKPESVNKGVARECEEGGSQRV